MAAATTCEGREINQAVGRRTAGNFPAIAVAHAAAAVDSELAVEQPQDDWSSITNVLQGDRETSETMHPGRPRRRRSLTADRPGHGVDGNASEELWTAALNTISARRRSMWAKVNHEQEGMNPKTKQRAYATKGQEAIEFGLQTPPPPRCRN
jgi:hypothetical protein